LRACGLGLLFVLLTAPTIPAQKGTDAPTEPPLLQLNDAEKQIDLRKLIAGQPDFTAIENYFSARAISGFSLSNKVARKGRQYRVDTSVVVAITELSKPVLRLNGNRTYEEGVGAHHAFVSATSPLNPTDLLGFDDITFSAVGAIELNGARLIKIRATSKGFDQEVFLYADPSKKNLITIVQIIGNERRSVQRFEQVSFSVPDSLFDISAYKAVPKFDWKKVPNAKVTLKGVLVEDGRVYRHADYLFVHAAEFNHFFIDLKNQSAETVFFQGLLVAKDGQYVWRTSENEAISIGELDNMIKKDSENYVNVKTTPNSVSVPYSSKKKQTLLTVEW
jgi:hypothetical protein